ncbi:MAG: DoxX family protein [Caldilineaceae bacterium]|nr:DoxX family protein [Caldilineaceae bacterium]
MAGVTKAFQYERAKASLPWVKDTPRGLVTFIGISELLGGLGLVLPALTGIWPVLTPLAALGLALIMVLAIIFHAMRRESQAIVFNVVLLVLAVFVAYGRFTLVPLS